MAMSQHISNPLTRLISQESDAGHSSSEVQQSVSLDMDSILLQNWLQEAATSQAAAQRTQAAPTHNVTVDDADQLLGHAHLQQPVQQPAVAQAPTSSVPLDLSTVVALVRHGGLFLLIVCIKLLYDHRLGILVLIGFFGTMYYARSKFDQVIAQIALRDCNYVRAVLYLGWLVLFLICNIFSIYYLFYDQHLWTALYFILPNVGDMDVWSLGWVISLTDFAIRCMALIAKCLLAMVPRSLLSSRKRSKYCLFTDQLSLLYRSTTPIIPWYHFLADDQHVGWWISAFLVVIYVPAKIYHLLNRLKKTAASFMKICIQVPFGSRPNTAELSAAGDSCPICQDGYRDAVILSCKHIFCEDCVAVWFEKEKSCPMCRANMTDVVGAMDSTLNMGTQWY